MIGDRTGQFAWPFTIAAGVLLIGAFAWAVIVPRIEPIRWPDAFKLPDPTTVPEAGRELGAPGPNHSLNRTNSVALKRPDMTGGSGYMRTLHRAAALNAGRHCAAPRSAAFLRDRVVPAIGPRTLGAALKGDELGQFWKNRVGCYRIIAEMHDSEVRIVVVRFGHRRDVCR